MEWSHLELVELELKTGPTCERGFQKQLPDIKKIFARTNVKYIGNCTNFVGFYFLRKVPPQYCSIPAQLKLILCPQEKYEIRFWEIGKKPITGEAHLDFAQEAKHAQVHFSPPCPGSSPLPPSPPSRRLLCNFHQPLCLEVALWASFKPRHCHPHLHQHL